MSVFLGSFALATFLSFILGTLEMIPWRRSNGAHWTERARARYPFRVFTASIAWLMPGALGLFAVAVARETAWGAVMIGGYLGAIAGQYPLDRKLYPALGAGKWLHLATTQVVMTFARFGVLATAIVLMPPKLSWMSVVVIVGFLVAHFGLQYGGALRLLRWLRVLRPAEARLAAIVEEMSAQCGVKPRGIWELSSPEANAFAVVTTGELLFTEKVLAAATDEEIKAICAHELGHLAEGRVVLSVRIFGSLTLLPLIFLVPVTASWGWAGAGALALGSALMWILNAKFAHRMEKKADQAAIATIQDGPAYARALERIHRTNEWPAVLPKKNLRTHPDLFDRMIAAGMTPEFAKPEPPRDTSWSVVCLSAFCGMALMKLLTTW